MNKRLILLPLAFCAIATASVRAEELKTPSPPPASIIPADNPGSFDPAAATQAWLDTVPADKRAKSDAYFEGSYWLILWNLLLTVAISILLLQSRISASLRNFAERCARFRWLQVAIYVVGFVIIMAALSF